MSKTYNVEVHIRQTRGDINRLIRKFTKKCKKERIIEDYLDRRFFTKRSEKKRKEKLKKIKNARKAEIDRNKAVKVNKGRR
jgi:ribosomal protein S21